ncbi:GFA family protein [Altererythrobacter xixiisoli]|uniref:GFA family protein n=1 Tax=Croceibacterium xixiisoli TaxID=1476466 RepID=A0A6I4TRW7_9SPHN|nr:GFA family protein [Croceibacterium xixiisoli]MXO98696.1 GFA family protein [Croceibacterium xixiisoli]
MAPLQERACACHCGGVHFTIRLPQDQTGIRCNCSICSMKGAVMIGLPSDHLTVTQGEDLLRCYQFHSMTAKHWFCSRCGIHCFHQRRATPDQFAVNAACITGVRLYEDFPDLAVADGAHHPRDNDGKSGIAGRLRYESAPE